MEAAQERKPNAVKGKPARNNLLARDYTEADIAWLEAQDLTDSTVVTALQSAYEQNDPAQRGTIVLRRTPYGHSVGSEAELKQRIAEAEAVLKETPKHYETRVRRLMAMVGLTLHAKVKAESASAGA